MSKRNRKYRRTARLLAQLPPILTVTDAVLNEVRSRQTQFGFEIDDDVALSSALFMTAMEATQGWQDGATVETCIWHEGQSLFTYRAHMFAATADMPRQMAIELADEEATAGLDEFCVCSRVTAPRDASTSAQWNEAGNHTPRMGETAM